MTTCGIYLLDKNYNLLICKAFGTYSQWSIPKGLCGRQESLLDAAIRELEEETNIDYSTLKVKLIQKLPDQKYKTGAKTLTSWLIIVNQGFKEFELKCNSFFQKEEQEYPEISEFRWVSIDTAKSFLHESQIKNLDFIQDILTFA